VDQLVERVLAVGARLAPEDLAGLGGDRRAVRLHALAVGLHRQLLQVGREAVQVLRVRQHGVAAGLEEVDVPDVEQAHERRHVLAPRRGGEVLVDRVEAGEEVLEPFSGPMATATSRADGGVDGVAAADPVPEAEGVGGSMPNSATLSSAVETATKCLAMASACEASDPSIAPPLGQ
jgi:hypothetical protein